MLINPDFSVDVALQEVVHVCVCHGVCVCVCVCWGGVEVGTVDQFH